MRPFAPRLTPLIALVAPLACRPDLGPSVSLVTSTRLLAVRADPPETLPGATATYAALVASPEGTVSSAPVAWSFCAAPKPLAEDNAVSGACLDASSLTPVGVGPVLVAATPGDACRLFGPDTPPGGFRPRDADVTGGYYQPLRADLPGEPASFLLARVTCHLASAPPDVATAFAAAYVPNTNPRLAPLEATLDGRPVALSGLPAGARVSLRASWDAASAESYVVFDPASQSLVTRREALRVSFYTTAGSFDAEVVGRDEGDEATFVEDGFTLPGSGGAVHLWLVLRDSRGGSALAGYDLEVR